MNFLALTAFLATTIALSNASWWSWSYSNSNSGSSNSGSSSNTNDAKKACTVFSTCLSDALKIKKKCDNLTDVINTKYPPSTSTERNVCNKAKSRWLQEQNRRLEKIKCINASINSVVNLCDDDEEDECKALVGNYSSPKAKRSVAMVNLEAKEVHLKRRRRQSTGSASGTDRPCEYDNCNPVTTPAPTTTTRAPSTTTRASTAAPTPEQALRIQLEQCLDQLEDADEDCKALSECCSMHKYCEYKFQKDNDFNDWLNAHKDEDDARRSCSCLPSRPRFLTWWHKYFKKW